MATIQIRGIPNDAYEVIRRRAQAENRSIQSYMLEHVLEFTARPTKAEIFAEWDRRAAELGASPGLTSEEIVREIQAGRRERDAALAPLSDD